MARESFSLFSCLSRLWRGNKAPRRPCSSCTLRLKLNHHLQVPPPAWHTSGTWQGKFQSQETQTPEAGSVPQSSGCLWLEGWEVAETQTPQGLERREAAETKDGRPAVSLRAMVPTRTALAKIVEVQRKAFQTPARTQSNATAPRTLNSAQGNLPAPRSSCPGTFC